MMIPGQKVKVITSIELLNRDCYIGFSLGKTIANQVVTVKYVQDSDITVVKSGYGDVVWILTKYLQPIDSQLMLFEL